MPAGYSGTPLVQKLGYKVGFRVFLDGGPANYHELVHPLPNEVTFVSKLTKPVDLIHLFTKSAKELAAKLERYRSKIIQNGTIWVSWPKKASKVPTNITEDVIRATAIPMGFVDVKVCAIDETWSGLKLVIRVSKRSDRKL
jgi:hypothetical protein